MRLLALAILPFALTTLSACESQAEKKADAAEDQVEREAALSASAAGNAEAALGLTERQLLDANLVTQDGSELGDIAQIQRDANGGVTGFLVEIEDSKPDRFVVVPLTGLTVRSHGNDRDLQTNMSAQDLAKLPEVRLNSP